MKIPANSLEAFLAVARLRHFTKAAAGLNITQSALSQRILNLEAQLETTLFVRDRAGPQLTPKGEELLRYAQTQEALEEEFLRSHEGIAGNLEGTVRIAGFSSVTRSILLPALAPLLREHPARCSFFSREMQELPELLKQGEADLVVVDNKIEREGVLAELLGYEENVRVQIRAKRIKESDWFLDHDTNDPTTLRYLQKFGGKPKRLKRRFLDDVYGLLEGTKLGLGQCILPKHLVDKEKELEILDPEKVLKTPVWLHYPAQAYYPKLHIRAREEILRHGRATLSPR